MAAVNVKVIAFTNASPHADRLVRQLMRNVRRCGVLDEVRFRLRYPTRSA